MSKKIIVVGGGGHGKVVIDAIKKAGEFNIHGIVDARLPKGASVLGIPVLGDDNILTDVFKKGITAADGEGVSV